MALTDKRDSREIFYVATDGNDAWSGRLCEANQQHTDGPFATITAAAKTIRRMKARGELTQGAVVYLRGGRYELRQPVVFSAADSGIPAVTGEWPTLATPPRPITYAACPGEQPVLSGGRRITGWRVVRAKGRTVWVASLPEVRTGHWYFRQLWVNGRRRPRPTLPRRGEYRVAEALDVKSGAGFADIFSGGGDRFRFAKRDLRAGWRNLRDVDILAYAYWVHVRAGITSVNERERIVTLDRNTIQSMGEGDQGVPYVVENVFEALSEPGEWYLDRVQGRLYYLPVRGEDTRVTEVIAPVLPCLVLIEGSKKQPSGQVEHLRFEGLAFAHNEWNPPMDYARSPQAACDVPGAVILKQASECVFERCRFEHLGTYAVTMEDDSCDNAIRACALRDLGAGGVRIWHGCRRNTVADCEIADGGIVHPSAVGVLVGKATGNQVVHNHIHDFYYTGVSVGWTWGYDESDAYGNIVEWNHIHAIGKGKLSDMGGIYTLGVSPGTRLRNNLIHDINARRYGAWCIYPDEGSTDILIENNICYRTNKQAFHQHYGRDNIVRNNIFAYGADQQAILSRIENHTSLHLHGNILLSAGCEMLSAGSCNLETLTEKLDLRRNLYWSERGPAKIMRRERTLGLRAFPNGFLAELKRFDRIMMNPLAAMPGEGLDSAARGLGQVARAGMRGGGAPDTAAWEGALRLPPLVLQDGGAAQGRMPDIRLLRDDANLYVRFVCLRPADPAKVKATMIWQKERVEVFLRPDLAKPACLQFAASIDGETSMVQHQAKADVSRLDWQAKVRRQANGGTWEAVFRIPVARVIAAAGGETKEWGILVGVLEPPAFIGLKDLQAAGNDKGSLIADPLFMAPHKGDFRLRANSPARKIGFLPIDLTGVGPRPEYCRGTTRASRR